MGRVTKSFAFESLIPDIQKCRSNFLVDGCVAFACCSSPLGEPRESGGRGVKREGVTVMPLAPCSVIPRVLRFDFECVGAQSCYIAILLLSA